MTAGTPGGRPARGELEKQAIQALRMREGAQLVLVRHAPYAYARVTESGGVVSLYMPDQEMLLNDGERLVPLYYPWHDMGLRW